MEILKFLSQATHRLIIGRYHQPQKGPEKPEINLLTNTLKMRLLVIGLKIP